MSRLNVVNSIENNFESNGYDFLLISYLIRLGVSRTSPGTSIHSGKAPFYVLCLHHMKRSWPRSTPFLKNVAFV